MLAARGDPVLPANPLQRGLLAPLRLCRRWQNPDRCPPGGDTREAGQCYELSGQALLPGEAAALQQESKVSHALWAGGHWGESGEAAGEDAASPSLRGQGTVEAGLWSHLRVTAPCSACLKRTAPACCLLCLPTSERTRAASWASAKEKQTKTKPKQINS